MEEKKKILLSEATIEEIENELKSRRTIGATEVLVASISYFLLEEMIKHFKEKKGLQPEEIRDCVEALGNIVSINRHL